MAPLELLDRLVADRVASRIWARDPAVFDTDEAAANLAGRIRQRLGWLDVPQAMAARAADLANFAHDCWDEQVRRVYLLGMGGSSLCAEVYRDVGPAAPLAPRLTVVDTTDERTIRELTETLVPAHALVIVASKSGGTVEVTALERHFWAAMDASLGKETGRHFLAITDPGTPLETLARERAYREVFMNPPDIGGRYSALSLFGLVPAALLRRSIDRLLESASAMATSCRENTPENPGVALGAFMAAAAAVGRDKLTLLAAPSYEPLTAWIEQLVAESTGKNGRGVLPIVGEPPGRPRDYGDDRAFVVVKSRTAGPSDLETLAAELAELGHPLFTIETSTSDLGAEFFRWEFATAVAGAALRVNPFDEPNVAEAKQRTQAQLDARRRLGAFKVDPPFERGQGYSRREHRPAGEPGETVGAYVAILDYLPHEPKRAEVIGRLRAALMRRSRLATTYGVGPRYLHSTGQFHKGGPNTGTFLLFTAVDNSVTAVPDTAYTFSALKFAQALGDFEALAAADRHVVHYHIEDPSADYTAALDSVLRGYR